MPRKPDLSIVGKVFNYLYVNKITDKYSSYGRRYYECTCLLCDRKHLVTKSDLIKGKVKTCGHHRIKKDITGKRFGNLTVLNLVEKDESKKNRQVIYHCRCDCGNELNVAYGDLVRGNTKSCGCLVKEKIKELFVEGTEPCKLKTKKTRVTNTTGFTGIYRDKAREKWVAEIMFKKKKYFLGRFNDIEDAKKARAKAEKELFGNFLEQYEKGNFKND